jgi:phage terminase small subunit
MKLTEKQKAFCDYYIELGNATEAATKAGYSEKTARFIGAENLTKPNISEYIEERLKEIESKRIADAKEVMEYLTAVMRGDVEEEVVVVENVGDYTSEARKIKKQVGVRERNKAAELLGKRYSMFTEKVNLDVSGVKIIDDIEDDADAED